MHGLGLWCDEGPGRPPGFWVGGHDRTFADSRLTPSGPTWSLGVSSLVASEDWVSVPHPYLPPSDLVSVELPSPPYTGPGLLSLSDLGPVG